MKMAWDFDTWLKPTTPANGCGQFTTDILRLHCLVLWQPLCSLYSIAIPLKDILMPIISIDQRNLCTSLMSDLGNRLILLNSMKFSIWFVSVYLGIKQHTLDIWIFRWNLCYHYSFLCICNPRWNIFAAIHIVLRASQGFLWNVWAFDWSHREMWCRTIAQFSSFSYFG